MSVMSIHQSGDERSLLQRVETTTATDDTVATFDSVIRYLRAQGVRDDLTVLEALQGAVDESEAWTNRTLRSAVDRVVYLRGFRQYLPLPFPPLQSVTSIEYYDVVDNLQTLAAADYDVQTPTRGLGRIVFQADYVFPNLNTDRPDPVIVTCVTGWGGSVPSVAKVGVRMMCEAIYDGSPAKRDEARRVLQPLVYRGI